MFTRNPDGSLRGGPGGAGALDTIPTRQGVGFLALTGGLQLSGSLNAFGGLRLVSGITSTSGSISAAGGLGEFDASAGSVTRTLGITSSPGVVVLCTRVESSANIVTIAAPSGGSINGKASVNLAQGDVLVLFSTSTSGVWVGGNIPAA